MEASLVELASDERRERPPMPQPWAFGPSKQGGAQPAAVAVAKGGKGQGAGKGQRASKGGALAKTQDKAVAAKAMQAGRVPLGQRTAGGSVTGGM